jgi:hypothetical protein
MLQHAQPHIRQTNQPEFSIFKENVDSWIKEFNGKMQKVQTVTAAVEENIENTNHNYELVQKMRHQLDALENEVKTLKLMQLLALKRSVGEKKE